MAYIGRPLNAGNLAVQSGTGDGSDTTPIATLDYSVGSSNSVAVYLDGVRQLAGTDFTASGTTLTFTTAPANGVGVDVYFLGLELSIPTPADATVAKAKITTTLINEHVDTTITAADSILFSDATDSNANKKDTVQGILDLAGVAGITSSANTTAIAISADEEVTMPLQPCFHVTTSGTLSNKTGAGTSYTIVWDTETFDQSGSFASNTFTAPITGKYLLIAMVTLSGITGAADSHQMHIITSNKTYMESFFETNAYGDQVVTEIQVIADMDAADTATVTTRVTGESSDVVDVVNGVNGGTQFSGCLLA